MMQVSLQLETSMSKTEIHLNVGNWTRFVKYVDNSPL